MVIVNVPIGYAEGDSPTVRCSANDSLIRTFNRPRDSPRPGHVSGFFFCRGSSRYCPRTAPWKPIVALLTVACYCAGVGWRCRPCAAVTRARCLQTGLTGERVNLAVDCCERRNDLGHGSQSARVDVLRKMVNVCRLSRRWHYGSVMREGCSAWQ